MKARLLIFLLSSTFSLYSLASIPPKSSTKQVDLLQDGIPKPKDQVFVLRRIAAFTLGDVEQRLSTDDLSKLAPYKEDPDTTRELLISILQDRIGSLQVTRSEDLKIVGPEGFKLRITLDAELLRRGIRRLSNWKPGWRADQVEKMIADLKDTIDP